MCAEWMNSFDQFLADVGTRPPGMCARRRVSKYVLDRKDNDGHYEPGNVRWVTRTQSMRNRGRK